MYALLIEEKIFLFDFLKSYGFYEQGEVNLSGYYVIRNYKVVLTHYLENYFDSNLLKIEQFSTFLQRICVNYLKDLCL